ncbi:hypothetical protein EV1_013110 [Malus domestica]
MNKFLNDMKREKPVRFTSQQLRIATYNFTNLLGRGGFVAVYKGIFSNGTLVAVMVLNGSSDKRIEEQFMAEVSTIGKIHHFNLVVDFVLAKLCNRDNTHITMTGGSGTPGYVAPKVCLRFPITQKCDVYNFGMLLFEIINRRKNLDNYIQESQDSFSSWVWKKFERGELGELMVVCGIEEKNKDNAERMVKVALWCV